jgi:hypothetical protein
MSMLEPCEHASFASESVGAADQRLIQKFDRDATIESTVTPLGKPDRSHSALADGRQQRIRPDTCARDRAGAGELNRRFEKTIIVLLKHRFDVGRQCRIAFAKRQ